MVHFFISQHVANNVLYFYARCTSDSNFNKGVPASLCPGSFKFHRVALNNIQPVSLEAQRMILNNSYGIDYSDFHTKRISHKPGWIGLLIDGETYRFSWEGGEKITNISYHATFYQFGVKLDSFMFIVQQIDIYYS